MKSRKFLSLIACAAIVGGSIGALTSCNNDDDADIIFMNGKTEVVEQFEYIADAYEEEKGHKVTIENLQSGQEAQLIASLGAGNDKSPSIFFMHGPVDYPTYEDYMMDLSDTELYADLTNDSFAVKDPDDGTVRALPMTVEGYGLIYNKNITDKYFALTTKSADVTVTSMDQIKDFDALKEVADDMQAHKADLGIDGVFASSGMKSGEQWRWHNHLFNMPIYAEYGNITGVPTDFDFTYNQNMKNLLDLYINDSAFSGDNAPSLANKSTADSMAEIAIGKAAIVQNGNWSTAQLSVDGATVSADDCYFMPMYMGNAGNLDQSTQGLAIGTDYHIAVNSRVSAAKQSTALDFLTWLVEGNGAKYVTASTDDHGLAFNPPYKQFEDAKFTDHLTAQVKEWMGKTDYTTIPWDFISAPSTEVMNKMDSGLTQYITNGMTDADWDDMVTAVKNQWVTDASLR